MIDRLDSFLEFPKVDPHGDPIPDDEGNIKNHNKIKLSLLKENNESELIGVHDSSDDFLRYLDKKKIAIGKNIKVLSIEPFDKSIHIEIDKKELMITEETAQNLLVKKV